MSVDFLIGCRGFLNNNNNNIILMQLNIIYKTNKQIVSILTTFRILLTFYDSFNGFSSRSSSTNNYSNNFEYFE